MASLSTTSIDRPVLAIVMSLAIILLGVIGFSFLGVREFPSVDPPVVTVQTSYIGANADVIESQITEPLEDAINGVPGIRTLTSVSREGRSSITVEFELGVNIEAAANDVRDKVSGALNRLPQDVDPPVVEKADADSSPIIFLTVRSDKRNLLETSRIAEVLFKERIQTIPGVSSVQIWGQQRYSMRLWMDPIKLASLKLAPSDVLQALNRENVELPSGRVEGQNTELTVRTMGRLNTEDDFNNLIIKEQGDNVVRLSDIGYAKLGAENERTILRRDGIPGCALAIVAQPGANNIDIADRLYKKLDQITRDLPPDVSYQMSYDSTKYIRASIFEVGETILIAFFLVLSIIFIFLRDWRTTVIPIATIPISLIGSFFVMYLLGFTINVLTLLGIVLAIGIVVDDAIVVLENIYVKVEQGENPEEAARKGSTEIYFAVISTTVSVVAVFLPVIFLQGLTGRLFREFGLVVASAVAISAFVSLTLTPMMSSKILKRRAVQPWLYRKTEPFFNRLTDGYASALDGFMRRRWLGFVVIVLSGAVIYFLGTSTPSELSPLEDRSEFRLQAQAQEGATFEYMDRNVKELTQFISDEVPERSGMVSVTAPGFGSAGVNSGFVRVILKDPKDRGRTQQQIVDDITGKVRKYSGVRTFTTQAQTIGDRRGGFPLQFVIQAADIEKLKKVLPQFMLKASASPLFAFVDLDLKFNKPEISITIDRDKARNLGVNVLDISQTLQLGLSGSRFGNFIMDGKQYQIIGQVERANRNEPLDLKTLYVKNKRGDLIQLDNLVTFEERSSPPQLFRFNRYSSAKVQAQLAKGVALGDGIKEMQKIADEVLDESYTTSLDGASREFAESSSSIYLAFLIALAIIYLILAGQFESFKDPLVIMFTVPLALAGALISLWYFNQTLNVFSQIGIIMLIGLVTKNGILIVEFANQRKEQGLAVLDAVKEAAASRFRPIIMTSLCTILGILPIALALGAGSESRVSMGIAVIGGMLFATVLTLFVIPAIYSYLSSKHAHVSVK
ncbi:MAG: efflux RND transporter permease subunit [Cytophagales bacterium]|jgi:multidrug efflux pump|nr:efflux RND transporter permease subunit [Cytophagales bacterium]MCA6388911.1 efflux RND transporter permease subunit [Cytophagales bacterium]MCA6391141.1 efflux RND transporter permease subunit [Cytophagales bacterium]MCA6397714.1 efflux RND transporter permease subunit [Cytophagales bacterium]MCA6401451.1 efflux RND transporter permease subunit [Cytophagales bacterium]